MRLQLNDSSTGWEPGDVLLGRRDARLKAALTTLVGAAQATLLLRRIGADGLDRLTEAQIVASAGVPRECAERVVAARTLGVATRSRVEPNASAPKRLFASLPEGFGRLDHEVVLGFALSNAYRVKAIIVLALGGVSGAALFPRDVFVPVLRHGAAALALAHNHPSGDATPSREDIVFTNALCRSAALLGVPLVDHLVVAGDAYTSLAEAGLMPDDAELDDLARTHLVPPADDGIPF
jgi:DNA repair protein RadC